MQARRKLTVSLFQRTLDCMADGVLLIGPARKVLYANRPFGRLWNIPEAALNGLLDREVFDLMAAQLVDAFKFRTEAERLYGSVEDSEDEILLKDGRVFARRSAPFEEEGDGFARIWIFSDVTDAIQAQIDPLTGLPNRRAYSIRYPALASAASDGFVKALAIMDIDNFKAYNDIYGHAAGDVVLQRVGRVIASHLRDPADSAFRIGGEEFVIACKARTAAGAMGFFERLRKSIASKAIPHRRNEPEGVVTASFGLAMFKEPRDPGLLFEAADQALYLSKSRGRNSVTIADLSDVPVVTPLEPGAFSPPAGFNAVVGRVSQAALK